MFIFNYFIVYMTMVLAPLFGEWMEMNQFHTAAASEYCDWVPLLRILTHILWLAGTECNLAMMSQSHSTPWRHNSNPKNLTASARERDRDRFEIYRLAAEHNFSSPLQGLNHAYFIAAYIKNNDLQYLLKRRGWSNDGFQERIIYAQCTVYNARWRNNVLQTML